jgi:hypothetical protein
MDDLRNHLFATIEALQDDDKPLALDRAKAICEVADRLIDTAKVEVNVYELLGCSPENSNFLALPDGENRTKPPEPKEVSTVTAITRGLGRA